MRARACWFLAAGILAACAPAPRAVSVASCAAPAEPTAIEAPCVVRGNGDYGFFSEYSLYLDRDSPDAVAVVHHPSRVGASWSDFPEPTRDTSARARIELDPHHGLRFTGYATLAGRGFHVLRRVDVRPGHAWVRAGSPVEIRGAKDGLVSISGYDETFEARTTCDNLAFVPFAKREADDVARAGGRSVYLSGSILHLAASPGSCALLTLPLAWTGTLQSFESSAGWAHVRGGGASFVFDGWTPLAELTNVAPDRDRDFSDPADDYDDCGPIAVARVDADVTLGQDGPRVGTLEKGTEVDVLMTRGDLTAIALHSRHLVAPAPKEFWVRTSALDPAQGPDGCPD